MQSRTSTIKIAGHEFTLRHWGYESAPPVVFLHGFPEYSGAWEEVGTRLADRFHCIAPDLRGYGGSWKPEGVENYRVGPMLADLKGVLSHAAGGAPVPLVAHDWGAGLAYVGASAMPELITHLVILNGVHPVPFGRELARGGPQAEASQYINWLRAEGSEGALAKDDYDLLNKMFEHVQPQPWFDEARRATYHEAWGQPGALTGMVNWYRASPFPIPEPGQSIPEDQLPKVDPDKLRIPMPHLIIWGDADVALTVETRDAVAPLCDDLRVESIAGCDHWLHHQAPDRVAALIADFIG